MHLKGMTMFTQLAGLRTYIMAVGLATCGLWMTIDELGVAAGWFDLPDVPTGLLALFGGGTAAAMRAALK